MTAPTLTTEEAADRIGAALQAMQQGSDMPLERFLIAAHAEIVALLSVTFGTDATAAACQSAAERLRVIGRRLEPCLTHSQPIGHA